MPIITEILMVTLAIGGIGMLAGTVLLFCYIVISGLLPAGKYFDTIIPKIIGGVVYFGLFLFALSLAVLSLEMAIEAIIKGSYNISFRKYSRIKTHIDYKDHPVRFILQTVLFIGFSMGITFFCVKELRGFFKRK